MIERRTRIELKKPLEGRQPGLWPMALLLTCLIALGGPPLAAEGFASPTGTATLTNLMAGHKALRAFNLERARELAKAVSPAERTSPDARFFLGKLAFYEGRYEEALALFGDSTFVGPDGRPDEFPGYVRQVADATRGLAVRESDHFRLSYQAEGPDRILPEYALSTLEQAYQVLSVELKFESPEKIRVEIYPDSRRFIQASGLLASEIETTGTVALCIYNKLMITSPRALALGYRWMDTLSHELVHLLVAQRTGNAVPVWLQEGLAKFLEVRWRGGRGAEMSPTSESLLAEALEANKLVPFERMSPSLAKLPSAEEAQLAFAQVQTVIEYILALQGPPGIHRLLDGMNEGLSDRQAIESATGQPFGPFTLAWKQFLRQKNLKRLPGVAVLPTILRAQDISQSGEPGTKIEDPFQEKNQRLRELTRLGDLLRERGRFRAALIEYHKARRSTEIESPALSVKIALTHLEGGNPEAALAELERSLERYDSFAPLYTTLGQVRLQLGDATGSIQAYQEANAVNPFDPIIHKRLALLYQDIGRLDDAQREQRVLEALLSPS